MPHPKEKGNCFILTNDIFNLDLSAAEIALYAFLIRMEDRKDYTCYPSYKTIGKAIKMSVNTVIKYVRKLEEKGLIVTEHTSVITNDGMKRNGNLMYHILPFKQALDTYYQWQISNGGMKKNR